MCTFKVPLIPLYIEIREVEMSAKAWRIVLAVFMLMMVAGTVWEAAATDPITTVIKTSFATGQVTVDTSADQIVAVNSSRAAVTICNIGDVDMYIGKSSVTSSTGFLVKTSACFTSDRTTAAIYGITASGSTTAAYWEN
jgi:hypothetical protein